MQVKQSGSERLRRKSGTSFVILIVNRESDEEKKIIINLIIGGYNYDAD